MATTGRAGDRPILSFSLHDSDGDRTRPVKKLREGSCLKKLREGSGLDEAVVEDLPEAAAAGDDVLVLVEAALLFPAGAGDGLEDVGRGHAAVEANGVDDQVGMVL